jgi:phage/plasmid primase-like uncharacterized protein
MSGIREPDIAHARAIDITDIAVTARLELKRQGGELVGPCPKCGGKDRFAIHVTKQVYHCRGCGSGGGGAIDFTGWLYDLSFRQAVERLLGQRFEIVAKPKPYAINKASHVAQARCIWREARDPIGTLAEGYLQGRLLDLDPSLAGRVLRFHRACPWGRQTVPALVAKFSLIAEPDDDALPVAILRVGLTPDGKKLDKKMLGPVAGAAIKLDADENVALGLGITEGLETALAVRATGWRPIWALGSAGAIQTFPPLAGVEALTIFADHDANRAGQDAARHCAERWAAAGIEVFIRAPREAGADWADVQP